jgi:hypothetical protein
LFSFCNYLNDLFVHDNLERIAYWAPIELEPQLKNLHGKAHLSDMHALSMFAKALDGTSPFDIKPINSANLCYNVMPTIDDASQSINIPSYQLFRDYPVTHFPGIRLLHIHIGTACLRINYIHFQGSSKPNLRKMVDFVNNPSDSAYPIYYPTLAAIAEDIS